MIKTYKYYQQAIQDIVDRLNQHLNLVKPQHIFIYERLTAQTTCFQVHRLKFCLKLEPSNNYKNLHYFQTSSFEIKENRSLTKIEEYALIEKFYYDLISNISLKRDQLLSDKQNNPIYQYSIHSLINNNINFK